MGATMLDGCHTFIIHFVSRKNKVPDRRRGNAYVRIINQYEASVLRFDGRNLVRRNKIGRHAKVAI
jgi:hypothetical protein